MRAYDILAIALSNGNLKVKRETNTQNFLKDHLQNYLKAQGYRCPGLIWINTNTNNSPKIKKLCYITHPLEPAERFYTLFCYILTISLTL